MDEDKISGRNGGRLKKTKKGDPANPGAGRVKGSLNSSAVISKWLNVRETIINPYNGEKVNLTQLEIITKVTATVPANK